MKDPILIVGAGAMGCLFAGALARSGYPVTMLDGWKQGVDALNDRGVRVIEPAGQEETYPVKAVIHPSDALGASMALVLVKTWQTGDAAAWLQTCLNKDGLAISLQNGLGNYEILAQSLGVGRSSVGITTLGATLIEPGRVRVHSQGEVVFGQHARLASLMDMMTAAGFNVVTTQDINGLLWGKLIVNAAVNPLTALLDVPNGQLLEIPEAGQLMQRLSAETESVAAALHIQLPFDSPLERIGEVLRLTAGNSSSMRQDLLRGAPTEIDAINGAITRYGEESGVATPYNRSVWQLVRAKAAINRSTTSA
jgi:2-dehydropantoate 2-reductase